MILTNKQLRARGFHTTMGILSALCTITVPLVAVIIALTWITANY